MKENFQSVRRVGIRFLDVQRVATPEFLELQPPQHWNPSGRVLLVLVWNALKTPQTSDAGTQRPVKHNSKS